MALIIFLCMLCFLGLHRGSICTDQKRPPEPHYRHTTNTELPGPYQPHLSGTVSHHSLVLTSISFLSLLLIFLLFFNSNTPHHLLSCKIHYLPPLLHFSLRPSLPKHNLKAEITCLPLTTHPQSSSLALASSASPPPSPSALVPPTPTPASPSSTAPLSPLPTAPPSIPAA